MVTVTAYRDQPVGVFGLGKVGKAAIAALMAGGANVYAWDDKPDSIAGLKSAMPQVQFLPLAVWPWASLAAVVPSPGVPFTFPKPHEVIERAQKSGVPIVSEIDLLQQVAPDARYVAITGTNGKSTTTALIGHILKEAGCRVQVGGNLGTAALSMEALGGDGIYVLELSSYQLDLARQFHAQVAIWLNLTPDHLDRHGSMEGYRDAKLRLFAHQGPEDVAIIGVDDEWSRAVAASQGKMSHCVTISATTAQAQGIWGAAGRLHVHLPQAEHVIDLRDVQSLQGSHNWQNAAAAYAACHALGLSHNAIETGMKQFPGLPHRMQLAATYRGLRFINDSKATNADAAARALATYEPIYWIAGGVPKAGGIESLAEYFPRIRHAFLLGEAEAAFANTLEGNVAYTRCGDLATALREAAVLAVNEAKPGAVVLLSPACASFDQWPNYEVRGEAFCRLAQEWVAATAPEGKVSNACA